MAVLVLAPSVTNCGQYSSIFSISVLHRQVLHLEPIGKTAHVCNRVGPGLVGLHRLYETYNSI